MEGFYWPVNVILVGGVEIMKDTFYGVFGN